MVCRKYVPSTSSAGPNVETPINFTEVVYVSNIELFERLAAVDPAALADANKQIRVMSPDIRPVQSGLQLLGKAYTVRCHEDFFAVITALEDAEPGDVLVIDSQDSQAAIVGELFSTEAERKGLHGIVIDGPCRDISTIEELDMPVYASSVTPVSGTTKALGEHQVTIVCGGIEVNPGDIVFGDDDGIIVASIEELMELLPLAEETKRLERRVLDQLAAGASLLSLVNFAEHRDALRAGNKGSTLKFLI
ncbi:MAG: 4-hydroxy-4-methyl-2-oxoglutarate aldolase [Gammaproteobacteria bacterium]|jgi:4-hydroxy-4-methyl-2-oxoglutarate aldolase